MIGIHQILDVSIVDIDGELSRHNVEDFDSTLTSLSRCSYTNVVLDCEKLKHLDYRLVQRIADRIVEFQCNGGDLKVAGVSKYVRCIMEAMGLEEELYDSVEDALLSFEQGRGDEVLQ
jgi:anti-anti-sigma factor